MTAKNKAVRWLLGLAGAVGGGAIGFFIYVWLIRQGFYAMILPGAALGAAGGFLFRDRSQAFGIVCAILAILLSILAEWWTFPFIADESFGYFLTHLQDLKLVTFIMIALGGLCGFWFGQGQQRIRSMRED